jgi:general secretion pathway protein G
MVDSSTIRATQLCEPFTVRERTVLLLALGLIVAIAITFQIHNAHVAKEAVLQADCRVIHSAALAYRQDKGKAPRSAQDLLEAGYLKALPRNFSAGGCSW